RRRQPFRWIMCGILAIWVVFAGLKLNESIQDKIWPRFDYPHQIDHGEGLMLGLWRTADQGNPLYSPFEDLPWVVNNYPPLYTSVVANQADNALDALSFGRSLSFGAYLVSMVMLALVVMGARRGGIGKPSLADCLAGILAGLYFGKMPHVLHWGTLMRVDMLGLCLTISGLAFVAMAGRRKTWPVIIAGILFLAAICTKHSLVMAPLALVLGCLNHRRRRVVRFSCCMAVAGGILFAVGLWQTDGEMWKHLIQANQTAWSMELCKFHVGRVWQEIGQAIVMAVLALVLSWSVFLSEYRQKGRTPRLVLGHYLWLTALGLLMTGKSGSNSNYYLEFYASVAMTLGLLVADLIAMPTLHYGKNLMRRVPIMVGMIVVFLGLLLGIPDVPMEPPYHREYAVPSAETAKGLEAVIAKIAQLDGPILSQDMSLPVLAGKDVIYHPFLMPDLKRRGLWRDTLLVRMIENKTFARVVLPILLENETQIGRESRQFGAMFTKETLLAILKNYELSTDPIRLPPYIESLHIYRPKQ
ncbi:MAG: hypothetical protein ACI97A_001184, partial [Planctomycetota bacterium]